MNLANIECSTGPGMKNALVNGFVPLTALNTNNSSEVSTRPDEYPLHDYAVQVQ